MWHVRAMSVAAVLMGVTVSRYVFVNWSNMLAYIVPRTISSG